MAIGDTATVKRAIDAQLSAQSVISNDDIMTLVKEIETGNNAWAVGRVDVLTSHAKLPDQIAKQIPPVKWFAASGHINGGVSGMVRLEANDDESAQLLRRQVNGALAFGEMVGRQDPAPRQSLKSLQMSGTGKTVQISSTVRAVPSLQMVLPNGPPWSRSSPSNRRKTRWEGSASRPISSSRAGNRGCRPFTFTGMEVFLLSLKR